MRHGARRVWHEGRYDTRRTGGHVARVTEPHLPRAQPDAVRRGQVRGQVLAQGSGGPGTPGVLHVGTGHRVPGHPFLLPNHRGVPGSQQVEGGQHAGPAPQE